MFKTVLVGVAYNSSVEAEAALALARRLATATGASVHALEVIPITTYSYAGAVSPAMGDSVEAMLEEANVRLRGLSGVQARAVYGIAGEELAAFSEEVDILIVGSRGYGAVRRLVLGSTSGYLERHARSSLLVLPRIARGA